MQTHKFKLIRVIENLRTEMTPHADFSYQFIGERTENLIDKITNRHKQEEVCVKYYNGDEKQKKSFNLDVAENTKNDITHVLKIVTKDEKIVKVVTGVITINGSVKTPDGRPSIVLYVPSKEDNSSYAYEYYGDLEIRRNVIYEDNEQCRTTDFIENKEEILADIDNYYQEVMAWWNNIYSKIKDDTGQST